MLRRRGQRGSRASRCLQLLLIAATVLAVAGPVGTVTPARAAPPDWMGTTAMGVGRAYPSAVVLDGTPCRAGSPPAWCGRVLVAGGWDASGQFLRSAEVYDPTARSWSATGSMGQARFRPNLVGLDDGRVMAVSAGDAEIYDPGSGSWSPTSPMVTSRGWASFRFPAVLLRDGRILVAGGAQSARSIGAAEVFDPRTGRWSATGQLNQTRANHTAVALADGRALVVGGSYNGDPDPPTGRNPAAESAEIYDPSTGTWTYVEQPPTSFQYSPSSILLPDGRVLVAGGRPTQVPREGEQRPAPGTAAMVYNPGTGRWSRADAAAAYGDEATLQALPAGRVLLMPAVPSFGTPQVYNSSSGTWDVFGQRPTRWAYGAVAVLPCRATGGRVLWVGGEDVESFGAANVAELFTAVPTVQRVSPPVVSAAGGADVTISGIGLAPRSGSVRVVAGGATVTGTANGDGTEVTLKAPAVSQEGPVDVNVTVGGVVAERCTPAPLVYRFPPSIDGISAESGPATGGQRVTLSGRGLAGATVSIDGAPVPGATVEAGRVAFDLPPHDPGPVTIRIAGELGEASRQYTYLPAIRSLAPKSGPLGGGTLLTVSGKGLAGTTEVKFGDLPAVVTSKSDGELKVTAPAHAVGKVPLSIVTGAGAAVPVDGALLEYEFVLDSLGGGGGLDSGNGLDNGGLGSNTGGSGSGTIGGGLGEGGLGAGGLGAGESGGGTGGLTTGGGLGAGGLGTGGGGGSSQLPVGGGGTGGGGSLPGAGGPGAPAVVPTPAPAPVASPASPRPLAPPAPPAPTPAAQAPGVGPTGIAGPGGPGAEGAPRYAMVGRDPSAAVPAMAAFGAALLMGLFAAFVLGSSAEGAASRSSPLGQLRPQPAYCGGVPSPIRRR